MELAGKVLVGVAVNYGVHYGSMVLHNWACMPHSITDILKGLVVTASPVCSTLLVIGQTTQNSYATLLTTTVSSSIISLLKSLTP
jgi:hypothetical protein